jgi:hypothetical protein
MSEITSDDRTTALGLFNYARSYRASADCLLSAKLKVPHPHAPLTFLYYHAIELYLKAYLRSQNHTVDDLKKVGHSVNKIFAKVQSSGLILDDEDKEVLALMVEADNVIRLKLTVNQPSSDFEGSSPSSPTSLRLLRKLRLGKPDAVCRNASRATRSRTLG